MAYQTGMALEVDIYESGSRTWRSAPLRDMPAEDMYSQSRIIIMPQPTRAPGHSRPTPGPFYPRPAQDTEDFLRQQLGVPNMIWTEMRRKATGYYYCQDVNHADGTKIGHVTMLKFLNLEVEGTAQQDQWGNYFGYNWLPFELVVRWDECRNTILAIVFQVCPQIKQRIKDQLSNYQEGNYQLGNYPSTNLTPLSLNLFLLEGVLELYDKSFWQLRENLRKIEHFHTPGKAPRPDYPLIHDLARHMIHHSESLETAIDTIGMIKGCCEMCFDNGNDSDVPQQMKLLSHFDMLLRQFHKRSYSLNARVTNEINLNFNLVVQYDSRAMRTISLLTLVFLPSTFVSALLGTNFFYVPDNGKFNYATEFWYIWLVPAIGLTTFVLAIWRWWYTSLDKSKSGGKTFPLGQPPV